MRACHTLRSGVEQIRAEQSAGAFCGAKPSPVETLAWVLSTWCWAWCAETSLWHLSFILTLPQRSKTLWHLTGCSGAQAQGIYGNVVNQHFCGTGPEGFDEKCVEGLYWEASSFELFLTESCSWSLPVAISIMEALGNTRPTAWVRCRIVNYGLRVCWGAGTWMQGSQRTWPPCWMYWFCARPLKDLVSVIYIKFFTLFLVTFSFL